MDVPFIETLVDGHHLDLLILLDVVPRGRVGLGPDDYSFARLPSATANRKASHAEIIYSPAGPVASRLRYQPPPATTMPTMAKLK